MQFRYSTAFQAGDNQMFANVLVDTGSAYLWVGGDQQYTPGSNTEVINATFGVGYGSGYVNGTAYKDHVTVASATADRQIIGSASYIDGFELWEPFDGILGLGPPGSNVNETSGINTTPTFMETLYSQGSIDDPVFGLYIPPFTDEPNTGEITFGGVDSSRFTGDIEWIPQSTPYNTHWGFNASSFAWGNITMTSPLYARTNCGTLPILLPTDQFFDMLDDVPGTSLDLSSDSQLTTCLIFASNMTADNLPPLEIGLGNLLLSIPAAGSIVPESLYATLNVTVDGKTHTYLCPGGPEYVNFGQKALEHVYSTYDIVNHLVGFALTA
ncbi:acid protease [Rhodofomes roseus]|uniref:Acid protease n=1 Tax=Rhodofomes roseus TaxID=34475 RepID=A0ABQ8K3X2_9APHY|nr:acid protease [Rhodofomes roseus]KAH9831592.1 acid protease [Rhodofomes roseus]